MARYYLLFGLLVLTDLASAEEYTIRGTHWGMTMEQVKAIEDWEYVTQTDSTLFYSGELKPGIATKLIYEFHNGLLVCIQYNLDRNKSTYIHFRSLLGKKYGNPYEDRTEEDRLRQIYKFEDAGRYNLARLADLVCAFWKIHNKGDTPQTYLSISLDNSRNARVSIIYINLEYKNQWEQLKKDKKRDATYRLENSDDL